MRDPDHNLALPGPKPSTVETSIKSEGGWWAGQDSNLQPDRYERPALTIELPARLGRAAGDKAQNVSAGNRVGGAERQTGAHALPVSIFLRKSEVVLHPP